jgi:hypothetical protein
VENGLDVVAVPIKRFGNISGGEAVYDIYIRVSRLGERSEEEATEVYEAQCRAWADRAGVAIDEVEEDTEVSGATAVAERRLERLLQKSRPASRRGSSRPTSTASGAI